MSRLWLVLPLLSVCGCSTSPAAAGMGAAAALIATLAALRLARRS